MAQFNNFEEWLENGNEPIDDPEIESLYSAIKELESNDYYTCRLESNGLYITKKNTNDTLRISQNTIPRLLDYIIQKYCDGIDIEAYLAYNRKLSEDD